MSLNSICPYLTIFPLEFPLHHLKKIEKGWVLDPFCGRGTTLLAARMLGFPAIGMDVNPVAVAISEAKLANSTPDRITALAKKLLSFPPDPAPAGEFWQKAFHPKTLDQILRLRNGLANRKGETAKALRATLLGALHGRVPKTKMSHFSNQMLSVFATKPDYTVRYWSKHASAAKKAPILDIIRERANRYFGSPLPKGRGKVVAKDARKFARFPMKFHAVICSPPYFGMNSYLSDQWLRNWFLGGAEKPVHIDSQQIATGTKELFAKNLSKVWKNAAKWTHSSAPLIIRFGSLPSKTSDPEAIIAASLQETEWQIKRVKTVTTTRGSFRQAKQMGSCMRKSKLAREIDVICIKRRIKP